MAFTFHRTNIHKGAALPTQRWSGEIILSKLSTLLLAIASGATAYIFARKLLYRDTGHQRYQDSNGNELGLERSGGTYRCIVVLTNPELDWFYFTDPRAGTHRLEFFETTIPERTWKITWGPGTLILHVSQLVELKPLLVEPDENAVEALFEEVQRRDAVTWALESEFFQSAAATDLPQPLVEPPMLN